MSILRTTLLVLPAQIVFRVAEATLPLVLSYFFGRNDATDVYYFAWAIFTFAGSLVFAAYQDSALVPILAEERLKRREGVPRLVGSLLVHTWVVGGAIAAAVALVALGWFRVRFGASPSFALASRMVLPFAVFLVAMSTRTFFGTLLAVERHFMVQPIASGLGAIVNIGLLVGLHDAVGVLLIPIASLAAELVATAVLAWFALRIAQIRIHLCFERPEPLRQFTRLVASEIGGSAATRINPVLDQLMAGLSGVIGAGTVLRYSGDVASLPTSLLQAALFPVLISHLGEHFARGELAQIRRTVQRALVTVILLLLLLSAALIAVRTPLLRLVFLRGEMDVAGVDKMAELIPYHAVGLAPFGALLVLVRAHVAIKNSGIMIGMGIANACANALFNVVLLRWLGLPGIALATSAVHLVIAIVFWVRFRTALGIREREATAAPA